MPKQQAEQKKPLRKLAWDAEIPHATEPRSAVKVPVYRLGWTCDIETLYKSYNTGYFSLSRDINIDWHETGPPYGLEPPRVIFLKNGTVALGVIPNYGPTFKFAHNDEVVEIMRKRLKTNPTGDPTWYRCSS